MGRGSNKQDFVDDFIMNFFIRNSFKESNYGSSEGAGSVKESVLEKESLILIILLEKKVKKHLARHF